MPTEIKSLTAFLRVELDDGTATLATVTVHDEDVRAEGVLARAVAGIDDKVRELTDGAVHVRDYALVTFDAYRAIKAADGLSNDVNFTVP